MLLRQKVLVIISLRKVVDLTLSIHYIGYMYERMYHLLQPKLDPERRVRILRSSKDPELVRFFLRTRSRGSTSMDLNGRITIQIDDAGGGTKGTWLEELAHALQYLKDGNIEAVLSGDDYERWKRELEVATCLLQRANRLKLSEIDRKESERIVQEYGEYYEER